jgi:hypothetical protein
MVLVSSNKLFHGLKFSITALVLYCRFFKTVKVSWSWIVIVVLSKMKKTKYLGFLISLCKPCKKRCRIAQKFNLFLFIRGLSCPSSVQTYLPQNCLMLTILRFHYNCLYLVVTLALKKNSKSCIGLKVKLQSAFNALRDLLPSANNSAEWSGRVWQPPADTNGCLTHFFWSAPKGHYYPGCHAQPSKFKL